MAGLSSMDGDLRLAYQSLSGRWQDLKTIWNDPVSLAFERQYWEPLDEQLSAMSRELERLAQVIAQAQRSMK